jgi:hypothetical protein
MFSNRLPSLTLAQEEGSDWVDILLQVGIVATFVAFAIAVVLIRIRMSKKKKSCDADTSV